MKSRWHLHILSISVTALTVVNALLAPVALSIRKDIYHLFLFFSFRQTEELVCRYRNPEFPHYHSISSSSWTMKTFTAILALLASRVIASPITEPVSELTERNLQACPPGGDLPPGTLYPSLSVLVSQKLPNIAFGSVSDLALHSFQSSFIEPLHLQLTPFTDQP
jgi:hypothetical protein